MSELFELKTANFNSKIYLNAQISDLNELISGRKAFLITDENVDCLYAERFPDLPKLVLIPGEDSKSFNTIMQIIDFLIKNEADRHSLIVGCGGGVVCDLAGLAASLYQRGIAFGFVPTTLLSQVDASVGGKNGINFYGYKNIIGTINQPEFVLIDTYFLKTLPSQEISCGLAQITKHALLADSDIVDFLEKNSRSILNLDADKINYLVKRSVEIKSSFVQEDEKDRGERYKLNLGHTLGHALEKVSCILHGEAVSIGICAACTISVKRDYLDLKDAVRINMLLTSLGLPTDLDEDVELILDALYKDKKRQNDGIRFVLLKKIGKPVLENISFKELEQALQDLC